MAEQRMKVRDKKVQKMTKDGLVEENLTDKSSVRVSNRASDVQMGGKQGEKEVSLVDKSSRQSERSGKNIRPSVQKSRDAPELIRAEKQSEDLGQSRKQQNRKRIRAEVGKESRLAEKSEAGQSGRLKEKRADLSENRGDSRRNQTGGSKKPKQKQRLKFAYEETGASVKNDKDMEKLNQMDTDGVNFRHQKQKEKAKKFSYEEAKKKKEAKQHSKKAQVYQANDGEAPGKKKSRLKFGEGESVKTEKTSVVKKAGSATSVALHREISKNEDDNAAVEGAHKLEESGEGVYRLEQRSARRRKQRAFRKRSRLERQEEKQAQAAAHQEQKKLKKQIQKQQIKRDYAKAKRSEQTVSKGNWDKSNELLANAAESLENAGADFIGICSNTMHKCLPAIKKKVNLPIVHIVDATVEEMKREGMSEGLLLGTRFTMEESFNKERFYKNGVNIIIPSLEERQLVHDIIFAELCRGIITNNSKEQYKKIIYKYCKGKETGVILGCTEIGLLIQQNFMDVPIFDTTQIHAKKIAMYMIE